MVAPPADFHAPSEARISNCTVGVVEFDVPLSNIHPYELAFSINDRRAQVVTNVPAGDVIVPLAP